MDDALPVFSNSGQECNKYDGSCLDSYMTYSVMGGDSCVTGGGSLMIDRWQEASTQLASARLGGASSPPNVLHLSSNSSSSVCSPSPAPYSAYSSGYVSSDEEHNVNVNNNFFGGGGGAFFGSETSSSVGSYSPGGGSTPSPGGSVGGPPLGSSPSGVQYFSELGSSNGNFEFLFEKGAKTQAENRDSLAMDRDSDDDEMNFGDWLDGDRCLGVVGGVMDFMDVDRTLSDMQNEPQSSCGGNEHSILKDLLAYPSGRQCSMNSPLKSGATATSQSANCAPLMGAVAIKLEEEENGGTFFENGGNFVDFQNSENLMIATSCGRLVSGDILDGDHLLLFKPPSTVSVGSNPWFAQNICSTITSTSHPTSFSPLSNAQNPVLTSASAVPGASRGLGSCEGAGKLWPMPCSSPSNQQAATNANSLQSASIHSCSSFGYGEGRRNFCDGSETGNSCGCHASAGVGGCHEGAICVSGGGFRKRSATEQEIREKLVALVALDDDDYERGLPSYNCSVSGSVSSSILGVRRRNHALRRSVAADGSRHKSRSLSSFASEQLVLSPAYNHLATGSSCSSTSNRIANSSSTSRNGSSPNGNLPLSIPKRQLSVPLPTESDHTYTSKAPPLGGHCGYGQQPRASAGTTAPQRRTGSILEHFLLSKRPLDPQKGSDAALAVDGLSNLQIGDQSSCCASTSATSTSSLSCSTTGNCGAGYQPHGRQAASDQQSANLLKKLLTGEMDSRREVHLQHQQQQKLLKHCCGCFEQQQQQQQQQQQGNSQQQRRKLQKSSISESYELLFGEAFSGIGGDSRSELGLDDEICGSDPDERDEDDVINIDLLEGDYAEGDLDKFWTSSGDEEMANSSEMEEILREQTRQDDLWMQHYISQLL